MAGQLSPLRSAPPRSPVRTAQDGPGPSSAAGQAGHPAARSTLGDWLAKERAQEKTERGQLLASALPGGGGAMKRLKARAARQHPATVADKWHARLNGAPKPIVDGKRRAAFEALVRADAMALARFGQIDPRLAADKMRAAVEDGTLGDGILAEDRKLLLEVLNQCTDPTDHLYQRLNLKIMPDTLPAYTDAQVVEKPAHLTSGTFASVFALKVEKSNGVVQDSVFKPLKATEQGWVGKWSGIPMDDPQAAMRNIATVSCAKKLGLDVIANTQLAIIDTGRGPLDPDLGLLMERAPGKQARDVGADTLKNPAVFKEVTKLQLLDHLTGQVDRHPNNYFIHVGSNGDVKVTGIDNDQCFGKDLLRPSDIRPLSGLPFHGTELPPVIDTAMASMIGGLGDDELHAMLDDKLSDEEIEAAVSRLQGIRLHVDQLRRDGWVIAPDRWDSPEVQGRFNAQNSYIGRELSKKPQVLAAG
ncbi:hypothetical protein [Acidovorax sp. NCPPB 3576]|uniref:hypothetical protein n=1 Tax=Acidovorax sp. NCPPB 3576 TaxID=2940488 RepID=UPI00234A2F45|nr:hypothetical protein [Acidovorax sp. NCPPB 3576]WCM89018.1 hypothetical protein M5C98_02910 [Acidovorax sp. NCPPB 3576]